MESWYYLKVLWWILRGIWVLLNNLYCIPTYVVWMFLLLPIRFVYPDLYWEIEGYFFSWLLSMVAFWTSSAGYNIIETGDDISDLLGTECMVMANHQSKSDVPILMTAFSTKPSLLNQLTWIIDKGFRWSTFGVVSGIHGDFFIAAGRDRREASLGQLRNYLRNTYTPRKRKWLVVFPEGGFLHKRRESGHRYAQKNNLPLLEHVTLPRMGAIHTIMDGIGPHKIACSDSVTDVLMQSTKLKYVIDLTIAYPHGEPLDLGSILFGYHTPRDVRLHYRVFPIQSIPHDNALLQDWVYRCYIQKDVALGNYYRTGIWNSQIFGSMEADSMASAGDSNHDKENLELPVGATSSRMRITLRSRVRSLNSQFEDGVGGSDRKIVPRSQLSVTGRNRTPLAESTQMEGTGEKTDQTGPQVDTVKIDTERTIHQNLLKIGILHVIFMSSTAAHVWMIYQFGLFCYQWV